MIDIKEVVTALRLRRHFNLLRYNIHPICELISKLTEGTGYLGTRSLLEIDEVLDLNMKVLSAKRITDCNSPDWQIETDLILHTNLLQANIIDLTRPRKRAGQELRQLLQRGLKTLFDVLTDSRQSWSKLLKITIKQVTKSVMIIGQLYRDNPPQITGIISKIYQNGR
jgi:hypothetical protein